MLNTRLQKVLGITAPLIMAPIGQTAEATLATAVCKAGALGTLAGRAAMPDDLRQQIRRVRQDTTRPFGVGFITHLLGPRPLHFDVAMEERVPVVTLSFGDPSPWVPIVHRSGAKVVCQVQSFDLAQRAADAGADVICVQGNEAGGHTGRENLIPFLIQTVTAFPHIPIIASGGITCGRSLAAVLAAGAEGAWIGTAFLACTEAAGVNPATRDAVVASNGRDTVFSAATDLVIDHGMSRQSWPPGVAVRHRPNDVTETWLGREDELARNPEAMADYYKRMSAKDPAVAMLYYGQGAGSIHKAKTAQAIIDDLVCDATAHMKRLST
jgi:nitronate monooxygenase